MTLFIAAAFAVGAALGAVLGWLSYEESAPER
jgi:hypothetical protein